MSIDDSLGYLKIEQIIKALDPSKGDILTLVEGVTF